MHTYVCVTCTCVHTCTLVVSKYVYNYKITHMQHEGNTHVTSVNHSYVYACSYILYFVSAILEMNFIEITKTFES